MKKLIVLLLMALCLSSCEKPQPSLYSGIWNMTENSTWTVSTFILKEDNSILEGEITYNNDPDIYFTGDVVGDTITFRFHKLFGKWDIYKVFTGVLTYESSGDYENCIRGVVKDTFQGKITKSEFVAYKIKK